MRQLTHTSPGAHEPDLASSLYELGTGQSEAGRSEDAQVAIEETVEIMRRLAGAVPSYEHDLAASLSTLGIVLAELGRNQHATAVAEEAVEILRRLVEVGPSHEDDLVGFQN